MEEENEKKSILDSIKAFINQARRIFTVSQKPDNDQYMQMVKVTGVGIILLGIIGFIVMFLFLIFGMGK